MKQCKLKCGIKSRTLPVTGEHLKFIISAQILDSNLTIQHHGRLHSSFLTVYKSLSYQHFLAIL